LVATNEGISPVPFAASPIDVLVLVQLYVIPVATGNVIAGLVLPAHTILSMIAGMTGAGLTVIVNVCGVPIQPVDPSMGLTVIVAVTGLVVVFIALNEAILPVPDTPRPIDG
jgi:hypothetical protein